FPHAERPEHVGVRGYLAIEIEVGERAPIARLALPDQGGFVAPRAANMAVEAIDAGVDRTADEPLCVRRLPVEHGVPRPRPLELGRELRPERLGIAFGFGVK